MGIFLSVGVCVLDIMLVIFIITFLFDALKSNWWKVFMHGVFYFFNLGVL